MKKLFLLTISFVFLGSITAWAAGSANAPQITNIRIVKAANDTTMTYSGVTVFVPAGQTVILGQTAQGAIVVRGINLNGIKLGDNILSSQGMAVLNYQPQDQYLEVVGGNRVTVQNKDGYQAVLSTGTAISVSDMQVTTIPVVTAQPVVQVKTMVTTQPQRTETTKDEMPDFVIESEVFSAATEQAAQDVEETEKILSQSTL